jgi:ferredoxin-NADP reductase
MQSSVIAVKRETPDTVLLTLAAPGFAFVPGQFMMLRTTIDGKVVQRSYSIACSPNGTTVQTAIKEQQHGTFSTHAQTFTRGDELELLGPFGKHFVLPLGDLTSDSHVVLIAGGSGITPYRSFLQAAANAKSPVKFTLIFSVKTGSDIIFKDDLAHFAKQLRFKTIVTFTRPTDHDLKTHAGPFGRITKKTITDAVPDVGKARFYVCGPTAMVVDTVDTLYKLGVEKGSILFEKFGSISD